MDSWMENWNDVRLSSFELILSPCESPVSPAKTHSLNCDNYNSVSCPSPLSSWPFNILAACFKLV